MSAHTAVDLSVRRRSWRDRIVAASPAMQRLLALVERIGPSRLPVLLLGETGAGKEVIAEAIHTVSHRPGELIAVNCAAIPPTLAESELFGHVRGAFTGADNPSIGLIRAADGGTLFLDEVGDLDLTVQGKLLRVLEDGQVRMVGGTATFPVNLRVVAATCRDLPAAVTERRFREDLYHRLAGATLRVPALRDRSEDILPLFERFLAEETNGQKRTVSSETAVWLQTRPWLGNVRELRQAVRRAVVLGGEKLLPEHFLLETPLAGDSGPDLTGWLTGRRWADIEREILAWAFDFYGGIRPAAAALGRAHSTLYDRAERYDLASTRQK